MSGCGGTALSSISLSDAVPPSVGSVEDAGAPAAQPEPSQAETQESAAPDPSSAVPEGGETAYGSGTYIVEGINESTHKLDRLEFQDGQLVYHLFSDPQFGKGSYGRDGSDPLEFSPYYQKTVEEVIPLLEEEDLTVTVQQQ